MAACAAELDLCAPLSRLPFEPEPCTTYRQLDFDLTGMAGDGSCHFSVNMVSMDVFRSCEVSDVCGNCEISDVCSGSCSSPEDCNVQDVCKIPEVCNGPESCKGPEVCNAGFREFSQCKGDACVCNDAYSLHMLFKLDDFEHYMRCVANSSGLTCMT